MADQAKTILEGLVPFLEKKVRHLSRSGAGSSILGCRRGAWEEASTFRRQIRWVERNTPARNAARDILHTGHPSVLSRRTQEVYSRIPPFFTGDISMASDGLQGSCEYLLTFFWPFYNPQKKVTSDCISSVPAEEELEQ